MLERFLSQTTFTSQDDFIQNFHVKVPENFNFGYDVVDAWAAEAPDKIALCWTNDHGVHHDFTFFRTERLHRPHGFLFPIVRHRTWGHGHAYIETPV